MEMPYDITEAMIQCFGRCFHFKDKMEAFMRAAGVPASIAQRHRDQYKFVWARKTLADLSQTDGGYALQRRLLTELCKLRNVPDPDVADRDSALAALRGLKDLALAQKLVAKEEKSETTDRQALARERERVSAERAKKLSELNREFCEALMNPNRQRAGYFLEDLLYELFSLHGIDYRKPYRTATEQIDGHVPFGGFDYLVEARWRKDQPGVQEIEGFKGKVDRKLESTRGLFIAVQGIRPEVIVQFEGRGCNIVFWDGADLIEILEGRIDLRDAMKFKIERAAQEGKAFVSLRDFEKR